MHHIYNYGVEVYKTNHNKYIFCVIRIAARSITYFCGQTEKHQTHRWMQLEHWAEFEKKLLYLVDNYDLKCHLMTAKTYRLKHCLKLTLKNSKIPIEWLCKTLEDLKINPEDVVGTIECHFEYRDYENFKEDLLLSPSRLEYVPEQPEIDLSCLYVPSKIYDPAEETVDAHMNENVEEYSPEKCESQPLSEDVVFIEDSSSVALQSLNDSPKVPIKRPKNKRLQTICEDSGDESDESSNNSVKNINFSKAHAVLKKDRTNKTLKEHDENFITLRKPRDKRSSSAKNTKNIEISKKSSKTTSIKTKTKQESIDTAPKIRLTYSKTAAKTSEAMKNLFGSDNENDNKNNDEQLPALATPKSLTSRNLQAKSETKKKKPKHDTNKETCSQEKRSINDWLGKTSYNNDPLNDGPENSKAKKRKTDLSSPLPKSPESVISPSSMKRIEDGIKWKEKQTAFNQIQTKMIKQLCPKVPEKVKVLDLMHLKTPEILSTFEEYQDHLEKLFLKYRNRTNARTDDGVDHYLVMDLISSQSQYEIMEKLSEHYEINHKAPKYGQLFSMVLMPEWILQIFMRHHDMERKEAVAHIKAQNKYQALKINNNDTLDCNLTFN